MSRPPLALRIALRGAICLQVVLLLVRLVLEVRLVGSAAPPEGGLPTVVVDTLTMAVFPAVGIVILRRQPSHPVGWLFCIANVGWIVNATVRSYVRLGVVAEPGSLPAPEAVAWLYTWPGFASSAFYVLLVLLFPAGRFLSRRWRLLGQATVVSMAAAGLFAAIAPGRLDPSLGVALDNPLGVAGATSGPLLYEASTWGYPVAILLLLAAVVSAVLRYRRAGGIERLQLKWFASGLAAWGVLLGVYLGVALRFPTWDFPLWARGFELAAHLGAGMFPIAAGVAILRYRLYEIDRIISRTVSYVLITMALASIYIAGVVGLGSVVRALTGAEGGDLLVAGSTLAAAAAFVPLRRRVQAGVDRRFHRARYDAQRTVEAFGQRLRDEVDLIALTGDLRSVVISTVQPATVGLWLRTEGRP